MRIIQVLHKNSRALRKAGGEIQAREVRAHDAHQISKSASRSTRPVPAREAVRLGGAHGLVLKLETSPRGCRKGTAPQVSPPGKVVRVRLDLSPQRSDLFCHHQSRTSTVPLESYDFGDFISYASSDVVLTTVRAC